MLWGLQPRGALALLCSKWWSCLSSSTWLHNVHHLLSGVLFQLRVSRSCAFACSASSASRSCDFRKSMLVWLPVDVCT